MPPELGGPLRARQQHSNGHGDGVQANRGCGRTDANCIAGDHHRVENDIA